LRCHRRACPYQHAWVLATRGKSPSCALSFPNIPITFTRQRRDIKCSSVPSHRNSGAVHGQPAERPRRSCVTQGYRRINQRVRPLEPLPDVCRVRPLCVAASLGRSPSMRKTWPGTIVAQRAAASNRHPSRLDATCTSRRDRLARSSSTSADPEIRADGGVRRSSSCHSEHYRHAWFAYCLTACRSTFFLIGESWSTTIEREVQATDLAYHSQKAKFKDGPSTLTVWNIRTEFEAPTETASCRPQLRT
jgi:hypothetical protein